MTEPMDSATLADWGEFRVLEEIVLPRTSGPGGSPADVAFVEAPGHRLAITIDAAPQPLIWDLNGRSWFTRGWYAVVPVLSDLAAAGATPTGLCTAVKAPPDMKVSELAAFFDGLAAACEEFDTPLAGGDLRAGGEFSCVGSAVGAPPEGARIGRHGCDSGDVLVSVGALGRFMATYLRAVRIGYDALTGAERERLERPRPQLREMRSLAARGLIKAASDNSDGVLGSIWNLAEASRCSFELALDEGTLDPALREEAEAAQIDPWNVALSWGDWNVIASVAGDRVDDVFAAADADEIDLTVLAKATPGPSAVHACLGGKKVKLPILRNENFRERSFNRGLGPHVDYMLRTPLVVRDEKWS